MDLVTKKGKHLPNFFIVGAAKSGTTSLYYYLKQHPEVYMSSIKEPNFFAYEEIVAQNLFYKERGIGTIEEYVRLFKNVKEEKAIGEASVSYLFYPKVPVKIKNTIPNAKIIIMLRNPVDRAYSHYLMDYRLGYVDVPFEEIIYKKTSHKLVDLYYQQYVELGLYYSQVKRYLNIFGKEKVKVFLNEDLKKNSKKVLLLLYEFLGIEKNFIPNMNKKHNTFEMPKNKVIHRLYSNKVIRTAFKNITPSSYLETVKKIFFHKGQKPELHSEFKEYLTKFYKSDIEKLENLINRDLSRWYG